MNIEARASNQEEVISYHRSSGWTIIRSKRAKVVFATRKSPRNSDYLWVKAWTGTARVPVWNYTFSTQEKAHKTALELVESVSRIEARKASDKADRKAKQTALKASDHWQVGDCVYTSWGYDQTNVEYYQITEVKAKSVVVRQIAANSSDQGQPGGGKIAPRRYEYTGPELLCPLNADGKFSAGPCYGEKKKPAFRHTCYKWAGQALYTSSDR